jgi:hypothetical protein
VNAGILSTSISGTSGDGVITAILGLIATALLLFRVAGRFSNGLTAIVPLFLLLLAFGTAVYDWSNLTEQESDGIMTVAVQPGWGIVAVTLGSAIGFIFCIVSIVKESY